MNNFGQLIPSFRRKKRKVSQEIKGETTAKETAAKVSETTAKLLLNELLPTEFSELHPARLALVPGRPGPVQLSASFTAVFVASGRRGEVRYPLVQ